MVVQIYCVVSGGIPILHRSSGEGNLLSFSELAPLNGIQVFGKVYSVSFHSTKGKDFSIYWKSFTEKLLLILICKHAIINDVELVLNSIFDSMVLTVGIDELTNVKHVDRLKKEIRPSYPFIDEILRNADEFSENRSTISLLSLTEVFPSTLSCVLQEKLEEWSESISSLFCCLSIKEKIVVATPAWWDLTAIEKNLLSLMVAFNYSCSTFDIPVFLPVKSPKVAFRLISCNLMSDIWVSALCGPSPQIMEFEQSAALCWGSISDHLKTISSSFIPQIIPENMNMQNGIAGFIFMNYRVGKYILHGSVEDNKTYFDFLRIFYYQNIMELLTENDENEVTKVRETYWYSENYKLYGVIQDVHVLCLITSSVVPTYSARQITKDLLTILNNKMFLW